MSKAERRGPTEKMQEAFIHTAKKYEGTAVFAPTMTDLARAMGLNHSLDIQAYSRGIRYPHILKALSGLDAIHYGFVLGDPDAIGGDIQVPKLESLEISEARATLDSLSPEDRQKLISELQTE